MKRLSYPPSLAAAVEAVASTGGQIMPPLMGAGAFIMAELLGMNYSHIMSAAIFQAIIVPTTAAYIICVSVAGPILEEFGLAPLQAHLFIFWFALLSTITPPVCGTVFIASGMAQTPWFEVAMKAMKLGLGLYIIPVAFIVNDQLIYPQLNLWGALFAFLKIGIGLVLFSNAIVGTNRAFWLRIGLALTGLFIIFLPLSW